MRLPGLVTTARGRRGPAGFAGGAVLAAVVLVLLASPEAASAAPRERVAAVSPVIASPTSTPPLLRAGSRGPDVVTLQRRLLALHYDLGSVNGVFGDDTVHAVRAFQKVQGIGVDGVVGPDTRSRLNSPVIPHSRYRSASAGLEIDLSRRVLYVTRAGAVTSILDASPGKSSTPTVTGTFSIYRRVNAWDTSPLGRLWRPAYFYRGYAVHGSTSVPVHAASHGCVRLTVASMNRLWPHLVNGERVHVYRS